MVTGDGQPLARAGGCVGIIVGKGRVYLAAVSEVVDESKQRGSQ